jgi:hypothetical protein
MCLSRFFSVPRIRFIFVQRLVSFLFPCVCAPLCSMSVNRQIAETASCRLLLFFPMSRFSTMFTLCVTHLLSVDCRALSSDFSHYSMTRHIFFADKRLCASLFSRFSQTHTTMYRPSGGVCTWNDFTLYFGIV